MAEGKIIQGPIIHCVDPYSLTVIQNGFVIVDNEGKIAAVGDAADLHTAKKKFNFAREDLITLGKTQLLLPGLIDTHIHAPQYPNAGLGYDKPLLEWLDNYTYKLEKQYRDQELCKRVFDAVVRKTLDHGTTTACYFGSLFRDSTLVLASSVTRYGQRAFVGKINMTKLAPEDYVETAEKSIEDTLEFVKEVKNIGNPLLQPIITPRFALSVDMELMKKLGAIAKEQDLHIQTHISENKDEVKMVHELYDNKSYADVYNEANLLTPKTVLAHGIYLSEDEMKLLSKTGTSISHCPESNVNLGSGICDVRKLKNHGITLGLGTDVAGGASPSIITAMRSAISASTNLSFADENSKPLTYIDVFYLATLGGAKALALDDQIGNFQVGKSFDAIIVDLDVKSSSADYLSTDLTPQELLQKLVCVGDDRNVVKVFVNGKIVK
ncbi:guanine deaminase [Tenebrio molitor]|uniref:guanine deaminase n=1 Tax=Tenebrio molitor TaxID=7067 RepID=UPI0036247780